MKKRKAREWYLVATRHDMVEDTKTMLSAAKAVKRLLDETYTIVAPFQIIKVREVLPSKRRSK